MISSFKFQISKAVQNIKTLLFIALLSLANAQSKFYDNTNLYDNKKLIIEMTISTVSCLHGKLFSEKMLIRLFTFQLSFECSIVLNIKTIDGPELLVFKCLGHKMKDEI